MIDFCSGLDTINTVLADKRKFFVKGTATHNSMNPCAHIGPDSPPDFRICQDAEIPGDGLAQYALMQVHDVTTKTRKNIFQPKAQEVGNRHSKAKCRQSTTR